MIINENAIDNILNELEVNGSDVNTLKNVKSKILSVKTTIPLYMIASLLEELAIHSSIFLNKKNQDGINYVYGLSTGIYLPDKNGSYKFKIIQGYTDEYKTKRLDDNTLFDVASITKLFTLLLTFKLIEYEVFKLDDKIADLAPEYSNLQDYTIEDILKLCGIIYTDGRIDGLSNDEALEKIKTIYLKSNDRTVNNYTDLGSIILAKVIEKMISKYYNLTYEQILNKYILDKYDLTSTMYNPNSNYQTTGNGNNDNLVHDPKTRSLNGISGSAGLFTTSEDLAKLADHMFKVNYVNYDYLKHLVSKDNLIKMGTNTFYNTPQANKGLLGLYVKHTDDNKFLAPKDYSNYVFTAQGWTGSSAIFDPINQIHNSILVGSIRKDLDSNLVKNDKPIGFIEAFHEYQDIVTKYTLILLTLKKYFDQNDYQMDLDITDLKNQKIKTL